MHLLRRDYHQPMKLPWGDHPLRQTIGDRFPDMPIIEPHAGSGALNDEVEQVLADWPIPSIAPIAGSALAGFRLDHFAEAGLVNGKPDTFLPWRGTSYLITTSTSVHARPYGGPRPPAQPKPIPTFSPNSIGAG